MKTMFIYCTKPKVYHNYNGLVYFYKLWICIKTIIKVSIAFEFIVKKYKLRLFKQTIRNTFLANLSNVCTNSSSQKVRFNVNVEIFTLRETHMNQCIWMTCSVHTVILNVIIILAYEVIGWIDYRMGMKHNVNNSISADCQKWKGSYSQRWGYKVTIINMQLCRSSIVRLLRRIYKIWIVGHL